MLFGRTYRGVIVSVIDVPAGRTIEQMVGESQADHYTDVPDGTEVGDIQQMDGTWLKPNKEETVKPAVKRKQGVSA